MIRRRIVFWSPPGLWAVCIFLLSAEERPILPPVPVPFLDKWTHLAAFGLLGFLITHALRRAHHLDVRRAAPLAILLVALYGASDEWHQSYVPGRVASALDWLADVTGGTLAQLIHWYDTRPSRTTSR